MLSVRSQALVMHGDRSSTASAEGSRRALIARSEPVNGAAERGRELLSTLKE